MRYLGIALLAGFLVFAGSPTVSGQTGIKKKRSSAQDYGKVVINTANSERYGLGPVQFDHWLHRTKTTCRVCHVDIGFAMKAGGTGIRAEDNMAGYYCGSCHNGKPFQGKVVFESCSREFRTGELKRCERCHSLGKQVKLENSFAAVTGDLPKERYGNGIDWVKAESAGAVKPVRHLEGVSPRASSLPVQKDFLLNPKVAGMPEIIFSHQKHTAWNGCQVCHPEIFIGVKKGTTKYSMVEIFDGKFCGVCHGKVAFPLMDCERCHTQPV
ncbi:MAG: hypothetical protein OEW15_15110 [Nitrospirota bacterium]|nr:hypothetical protein [Nitrospirota bacterium]